MRKTKIKLGDKVKCKVTGLVGIAVAITEFLNGCVQISVAPRVGKDNKLSEEVGIDEQSLEVVKPKQKTKRRSDVDEIIGGANTYGLKRKNM